MIYRRGHPMLQSAFDRAVEHMLHCDRISRVASTPKPATVPLRDGEPCNHPGCLRHVSHPCEGCGRVAGMTPNVEVTGAERASPAKRPCGPQG